jgi:hypothetical protein
MGFARYRHTQRAPLYWLLVLAAIALPLLLLFTEPDEAALPVLLPVAAVFLFLSFCFQSLTTVDRGDHLLIHYGPIPLFRKRVHYGQIREVAEARTSWLDGWGIHYFPGRGWTYNLWGFACVRIRIGGYQLQIGTDDPAGLAAFLREACDVA